MRTSIFLTTSLNTSWINTNPDYRDKPCLLKNENHCKLIHDSYCYIKNKYLYDYIFKEIRELEYNSVELFNTKKVWKSNVIFDFITKLNRENYDKEILIYNNYINELVNKVKDYKEKIDEYGNKNGIHNFAMSIDRDTFLNKYDILVKYKELFSFIINRKNDKECYKYLDKYKEDIGVIKKIIKKSNLNNFLDGFNRHEIRCEKLKVFRSLKATITNNRDEFKDFNTIQNKFKYFRNLLTNFEMDLNNIDDKNQIIDFYINEIKNYIKINSKINFLTPIIENEYTNNIKIDFFYKKKECQFVIKYKENREIYNLNNSFICEKCEDVLVSYIKEKADEMIKYCDDKFPKYIYELIHNINQFIQNNYRYFYLEIYKHTDNIMIQLKNKYQPFRIFGCIIFYNNQYKEKNISYNQSGNGIKVFVHKYSEEQIEIGCKNFFDKCIDYITFDTI